MADTLLVFDPNITADSPAGSCLLKMLRNVRQRWAVEVFAARTDLIEDARLTKVTVPAPRKPVVVQAMLFTVFSMIRYAFRPKQKALVINTQGLSFLRYFVRALLS